MSRGKKRAARAQEMRVLVNRWARSGLPMSRFAEREGVGRKTLSRWRKRLGVGGDQVRRGRPPMAAMRSERRSTGTAALFTEVSAAMSAAARPSVAFEIVLRGGERVRVPEDFKAGALGRLLVVLREC
jgi:transposase-like protein